MQTEFQKLCRTCLYTSKNLTEFISINTMDPLKKISTRSKIEMCIPEIDVEDPDSTFLCIACWNALNASYNFKCVCLATEDKLRKSICQLGEDDKYRNKNILYTEVDLLLDDIFTTDKTRIDLYQQAKFFLETQKIIKQYCYSQKNRICNSALEKHKPKTSKLSNLMMNKTKLRCKKCSKEFLDPKRYKLHMYKCGQYLASCKKCLKGFYFKQPYLNHIRKCKAATIVVTQKSKNTKKNVATTLKQSYRNNNLLNNKSSVKTQKRKPKIFQCFDCPKMFRDNWHLARHVKVHLKHKKKVRNTSTPHSSEVRHVQDSSHKITNPHWCENKDNGRINNETMEADKQKINVLLMGKETEDGKR